MESISDPIPPEFNYPEPQSNFNELIMKKLEAAQKKTKAPPPATDWEQERKLLLDMLEKAQSLVSQAHKSNSTEKQAYETRIESLQQELFELRQEGKALRFDRSDLRDSARSEQDLRLIKEVENIEKQFEAREAAYQREMDKLKSQLEVSLQQAQDLEKSISAKEKTRSFDQFRETELGTLQQENTKLKKQVESIVHSSCETEAELTEEIERLSQNHRFLTEISEKRETTLSGLIRKLTAFNAKLQDVNYGLKEKVSSIYDKLRQERSHSLKLYDTLCKRFDEGKGATTVSGLHDELNKLHSSLLEKESEIEALKIMKKDEVLAEPLPDFKNDLLGVQEKIRHAAQYSRNLNENMMTEEDTRDNELQMMTERNSQLRQNVNNLIGKNFENELTTLKIDFQKSLAEKNHAKKLVVFFIKSIQRLEAELKVNKNPEILRVQLEVNRLQEENRSLVETAGNQEKTYTAESRHLQDIIDSQNAFIDSLSEKLEFLKVKTNKDSYLSAIHGRIHALEITNQALNKQISFLESGEIIDSYESNVSLLKNKLENSKMTINALRDRWNKEKNSLKKEINDQKLYRENKGIMDQATTKAIADSNNQFLKVLEDYKLVFDEMIQVSSNKTQEFEEFNQTLQEDHGNFVKESHAILNILKKDISKLNG